MPTLNDQFFVRSCEDIMLLSAINGSKSVGLVSFSWYLVHLKKRKKCFHKSLYPSILIRFCSHKLITITKTPLNLKILNPHTHTLLARQPHQLLPHH